MTPMASERNKYSEMEAAFKAYKQRRSVAEKVEDGWFNARELAKQNNVDLREAQRAIRLLLDEGLVETKKFNIVSGTRLYPVIHYKLCKKKTR